MALSHYHVARHLSHLLTSHFLLIWLLVLVLVLVCGLLVSWSRHPILSNISQEKASIGKLKLPWKPTLADGIAAMAFAVFLTLYIVAIFHKEDFAYYDDDQITDFSLQGRSFPPPIWIDAGRYFPLGMQEFNVLGLITKSPVGFHTFAVVELIILLLALFAVLKEYKFTYRALILMAVMLAPSFVISFTGLILPERNVLFWLAIIVLCLYGHSKTKATIYFVGCLIATHFALYYKEPVIVLVVTYAFVQLCLEGYVGRRAGHSWQELARENDLPLGMLAVSGIYAALFLLTMLPHRNLSYVEEHRQALSAVLLVYAQTDWLPLILLGVFFIRLQRFMFSGGELDRLWDSLAVGALGYFFVVIALGLFSGYYMAPVDLIALLYLARVSLAWLLKPTRVRVSIVAIAFICIMLHNVAYSSFRVIERKNLIATTEELTDFLRNYQPQTDEVELFFPYATPYHLMGISSYLRYRGLHLVGQPVTSNVASPRLIIEGKETFPSGRCVDFREYSCSHADGPGSGALIVVLPEDRASTRDVENVGKDSVLLFSVKACEVCTRYAPWFRLLHAISPEFSTSPLPEHWLQLHVFKKTGSA